MDAAEGSDGSSDRLAHILGLVALVVLAAALRLHRLGDEDYWLDEVHSLIASAGGSREVPHHAVLESVPRPSALPETGGWGRVWRGMADDVHPPLYFCVLNGWRRLFGDGEAAVRALSVGCALVSLATLFGILRALGAGRAACWAVGLGTVAFADVDLARQARHYAMGVMWICLATYVLVLLDSRWSRSPAGTRAGAALAYAACVLGALMTHYLTVLVLPVHAAFALWPANGRRMWRWWLPAMAGAALTFAVLWGAVLYAQLTTGTGIDWLRVDGGRPLQDAVLRALNLPLRLLFAIRAGNLDPGLSAAGATAIGLSVIMLYRCRRAYGRAAALCALWFLVPTLALVVLDAARGSGTLGHVRYALFAWPGVAGALALTAVALRPAGEWVLGVAILAAALTLPYPTRANPEASAMTAELARVLDGGDLLLVDGRGGPAWFGGSLLIELGHYGAALSCAAVVLDAEPEPALQATIAGFGRIAVVNGRTVPPQDLVLAGHRLDARSPQFYRGLGHIYLFERVPAGGEPP